MKIAIKSHDILIFWYLMEIFMGISWWFLGLDAIDKIPFLTRGAGPSSSAFLQGGHGGAGHMEVAGDAAVLTLRKLVGNLGESMGWVSIYLVLGYLSIYLSIYRSIYVSIYLSIYLLDGLWVRYLSMGLVSINLSSMRILSTNRWIIAMYPFRQLGVWYPSICVRYPSICHYPSKYTCT